MKNILKSIVVITLFSVFMGNASDQPLVRATCYQGRFKLTRTQPLSEDAAHWVNELVLIKNSTSSAYQQVMIDSFIFRAKAVIQIDVPQEREMLAFFLENRHSA